MLGLLLDACGFVGSGCSSCRKGRHALLRFRRPIESSSPEADPDSRTYRPEEMIRQTPLVVGKRVHRVDHRSRQILRGSNSRLCDSPLTSAFARRMNRCGALRPEEPILASLSLGFRSACQWGDYWVPAVGRSVTFCTRQFPSSPTNSSFSLRQSIALTVPNSFSSLPARPNFPTIFPSRVIFRISPS